MAVMVPLEINDKYNSLNVYVNLIKNKPLNTNQ